MVHGTAVLASASRESARQRATGVSVRRRRTTPGTSVPASLLSWSLFLCFDVWATLMYHTSGCQGCRPPTRGGARLDRQEVRSVNQSGEPPLFSTDGANTFALRPVASTAPQCCTAGGRASQAGSMMSANCQLVHWQLLLALGRAPCPRAPHITRTRERDSVVVSKLHGGGGAHFLEELVKLRVLPPFGRGQRGGDFRRKVFGVGGGCV